MAFKVDPNTVYTLKEIEDGLGWVKVLTLRHWIIAGKLRGAKMGRIWVVLGEDLLEAIRKWKNTGKGSK